MTGVQDRTHPVPTSALVARHASATPNAVALTDDDRAVTYAELDSQANRLAHLLREHGVEPGQAVGVCLRRRVELVIALLAVWRAGGAYVPLAPDQPAQRITALLADTGAGLALTEADAQAPVEAAGAKALVLAEALAAASGCSAQPPAVPVGGDHPAYVLFTSGSTGRPKG